MFRFYVVPCPFSSLRRAASLRALLALPGHFRLLTFYPGCALLYHLEFVMEFGRHGTFEMEGVFLFAATALPREMF